MKDIARDPNARIKVDFTAFGEPCGEGSVKLSSYLGPLVREHVPVVIDDWRKIGDDRKTVLWKSVQLRFELDGEYEKAAVMKQMGCIWRASKSRLVNQILNAENHTERLKLRPDNIQLAEWKKFVKEKTSKEFRAVRESYKERRRKQIPHTCSRKGMVRLAEDLKKDGTEVTRLNVWVKSRTKKDGTAVNTDAADKIEKATEFIRSDHQGSSSSNPKEDTLTQILGPDNPGRLRAMGRGMSVSKLAFFEVKNKYVTEMQQTQNKLKQQVEELQEALAKMNSRRPESEEGENSAPRSVTNNWTPQPKCILYDWCDKECKVAEGRFLSSDEMEFVNNVPLGPNSVKVVVETAIEVDAFLWRPAPKIYTIGQAVGETVAWPQDSLLVLDEEIDPDHILGKSPETVEKNNCKLLHWLTQDEETVAEGRWESRDPKALVDGLPLGPNAVKVYVDAVTLPQTFLWRPTEKHSTLGDCLKSYVAWPLSRVSFDSLNSESPATESPITQSQVHTPPAPANILKPVAQTPSSSRKIVKEGQKCKLLDITGQKVVVAEGRWSSNNPEQLVHFVPLGKNAVRVWVDVVKVDDAMVWRPTSAIECMEDAIGTTIAWPEDKVVIV
ncbi:uncharacterized protein LOC106445946 [Brassica napus]|nr:uncharacterized protein LOC106445946 [Brassica napus]XP_022573767.1 uncharacterized protein LOC106445946 [Brassica napus]